MFMHECIFCKIITNQIPSHKVYEDDYVLAFLDIKPNHPGHTLVIPKEHFENIYSVPAEIFARMTVVAQKIAVALKQSLECDGVNLAMNNEKDAGQVIFHTHIHVIPRYAGDGFALFPPGDYATDTQAQEIALQLRKEM